MLKRVFPLVMICLVAATAAEAQPGGGHGGSGGGGGGGARGGPPPAGAPAPRAKPAKPFAEPEIIGVIKAIDADTGRVTIAYEASEVLNWPAGTQPFIVSKSALLKDLTVSEKVRFRLEDQQIATIRPF